jgi:hypothetical protein
MVSYNFKRLIKRYGKVKPILRQVNAGYRDYENGGVWVEGDIEYNEFEGAVVPIGEVLLIDNSGYTIEDKRLYTYEDMLSNQEVIHKGVKYTTMEYKGYEDFDDGLKIFVLKRGGKDD